MAERIVIVVDGGVVQDVYSSDPKIQVTLVDWDCDDADELHSVAFESSGKIELAYVLDVSPSPLSLLADSDIEKAIAAASFSHC